MTIHTTKHVDIPILRPCHHFHPWPAAHQSVEEAEQVDGVADQQMHHGVQVLVNARLDQ